MKNERAKLFATALNSLATFAAGTALIAPAVAVTWSLPVQPTATSAVQIVGGLLFWTFVSVTLHVGGQMVLWTVRQP